MDVVLALELGQLYQEYKYNKLAANYFERFAVLP
jgi:hypothetical protein